MDRLLRYLIDNHPAELLAGTAGIGVTGLLTVLGGRLARAQPARTEWPEITTTGQRIVLGFGFFCGLDSLLLWSLPHFGASFSPWVGPSRTLFILMRLGLLFSALIAMAVAAWRQEHQLFRGGKPNGDTAGRRRLLVLFAFINLSMSLFMARGYIIEPLSLETTEFELTLTNLVANERPLRIVHLTDTHVARYGPREAKVVSEVRKLEPDIILMTGDYLNTSYALDPQAAADWRRFVSQLHAPHGIYAVRGTLEHTLERMATLLEGTEVIWLEQEAVEVEVRGQTVTLVGVACSHDQARDTARLEDALTKVSRRGESQTASTTILLYHSPDLILEAVEREVDLVLGGHTHGGQVRLPLLGPVITYSHFGRRYAAGLYQESGTQMVISRGIGLEGGAAPRVRFFCRPEVVSIDLVGS
jgi:predicted MPP superfamily phosphohydrolase